MNRSLHRIAPAACALLALSAAAQPVTSPLGALGRTNEAVGAAEASTSNYSSEGPTTSAAPSNPPPMGHLDSTLPPIPPPGSPDDPEGEENRGISYDPEGRRDPFRALTGEAADTEDRKKFEGTLKGRLLSEVKLTSILKHPTGNIATLEGGPKKEGYFARVGSELWDGTVVTVDAEALVVVVRQKVDDPRMALKPWRDIVIPLWSDEEKKAEGGTTP